MSIYPLAPPRGRDGKSKSKVDFSFLEKIKPSHLYQRKYYFGLEKKDSMSDLRSSDPPTTMSESALNLAVSRNTASGNTAVSAIFGATRELLDALEKGDEFVWPEKAYVDVHFSTPPKQVTEPVDTDGWKQQWASFLADLDAGRISVQQAIEDGFKPVYFMLVEVSANAETSSRKGKVCKLYLKSLNKRVFEYTKDEDGNLITTKRFITSGGNVCNLTQQLPDFGQVHAKLKGKTIKVVGQETVTTKKYKPKKSTAPDELVQGHTYNLHCDQL